MLAEIYMLRLEAAARATATATTSSRFVPITLPALPHQTSDLGLADIKAGHDHRIISFLRARANRSKAGPEGIIEHQEFSST